MKKAAPRQPGQIKPLPIAKEVSLMIPERSPLEDLDRRLSVAFDVRVPEQAEALHIFRAAFAGQTDIEAVNADVFVLHIRPGICRCGEEAA